MTVLSGEALKRRLERREFTDLFVEELGWDRLRGVAEERLQIDGDAVRLTGLAQKRDVPLYLHRGLPDRERRRRVERELSRRQLEHLLVFLDEATGAQVWQWVKREAGRPDRVREHSWRPGQPVEALRQKLDALQFTLEEEEAGRIEVTQVTQRLKRAFDADRVTKRFYADFKAKHDALMAFLKGLPEAQRSWYASVTLNRLMFVWFIQKKGFVAGDPDYLVTKLAESKARGKDRFFRELLGPLFFRGFACPKDERSAADKTLLGDVPYLNGGLFQEHQIEREHGDAITLPDEAFADLFDFFGQWTWHLDERDARCERRGAQAGEINPDVLGYIFEKYVNQKQMGAYYTKEDVTEYICANTILPRLLDKVKALVPVAFRGEGSVWRLLADDPDRYIWPSVRHGLDRPLPEAVQAGIDDISSRKGVWDKPSTADLGLPTETWREVVHRRQRCEALRKRLAAGEIAGPDAMVTANLDIHRFVQDAISAASEDQLKSWWEALSSLTVLDPACGSGAFLFAALNLLEPLYTQLFDAMGTAVANAQSTACPERPFDKRRWKPLADVLDEASRHGNSAYFVLRQVSLNNLYGVDIMEEAAEICKLRLFLRLVAQLDDASQIEPLPDLDFNIRSGNSLVGIASEADFDRVAGSRLDWGEAKLRIKEEAETAALCFEKFRAGQLTDALNASDLTTVKEELRVRLRTLSVELDSWLAGQSGIDARDKANFGRWEVDNKPFHWWTEFYAVMAIGGFDALVGNPPYAEVPREIDRKPLIDTFAIALPRWSRDEDLSALFVERSSALAQAENGAVGMICPLSFAASTKATFAGLRQKVLSSPSPIWFSHFDRIPSALFGGDVRTRCTILVYRNAQSTKPERFTTELKRWNAVERSFLLESVSYAKLSTPIIAGIPKVGSQLQADVMGRLAARSSATLAISLQQSLSFNQLATSAPTAPAKSVLVGGVAYNWFPVWRDIPPTTQIDGTPSLPARTIGFRFDTDDQANAVFALLASSLGYWWWATASDGFNLKKWLIESFPISIRHIPAEAQVGLANLGNALWTKLKTQYVFKDNRGRVGNYYLPRCEAEVEAIDDFLAKHVPGLNADFFESIRSSNKAFSSLSENTDEEEAEAA